MEIVAPQQKSLNRIVSFLKKGGVVICPTDTVYGFLADAGNKRAVNKIYKIKARPKSKPLPVFVKDITMAKSLALIDAGQEKMVKSKWPGKYTFVLNKKNSKGTIALRIPKYAFLNRLLRAVNRPLAQTSVNISGQLTLTKMSDIVEQFNAFDVLVVDGGNLKSSKPSKIIDLSFGQSKILRK